MMRGALVVLAACSSGGSFGASGGTGESPRLALRGDSLYWAGRDGTVRRAMRDAGESSVFSSTRWSVEEIAASSSHVFWSTDAGMLAQAEIGGEERQLPLATAVFAANDERIVFADQTGISMVELPGGAERVLMPGRGAISLALDDDHVYGTVCAGDDSGIWRFELATGTIRQLTDTCSGHLVLDDQFIYAAQAVDDSRVGVVRTSKVSGVTETVIAGLTGTFAVRDGFVYLMVGSVVARVSADGAETVPVAQIGNSVLGLAVDDDTLYWVPAGSDVPGRLPLP